MAAQRAYEVLDESVNKKKWEYTSWHCGRVCRGGKKGKDLGPPLDSKVCVQLLGIQARSFSGAKHHDAYRVLVRADQLTGVSRSVPGYHVKGYWQGS